MKVWFELPDPAFGCPPSGYVCGGHVERAQASSLQTDAGEAPAVEAPFYTEALRYMPPLRRVHHNRAECPEGNEIDATDRQSGTGGKPLCEHCAHADFFRIEVRGDASFATVLLSGDIDLDTAQQVHRVVSEMFTRGTSRLTINLHDVTYLDSSGIRELMRAHFSARNYGTKVAIVGAHGPVARALEIAGLASIMS